MIRINTPPKESLYSWEANTKTWEDKLLEIWDNFWSNRND